ncbi:MAG: metallophosphoesterase family protein [Candidatus Micrarchaeia archaeon]
MAILIVSDLHYEKDRRYKGVDESNSFNNFVKLIEQTQANNVVVLGDIGHAWTDLDFQQLSETGAKFYFIYGNHDALDVLKKAKNKDGSNMLMNDGDVVEIEGFIFAFINGIVGNDTKPKEGTLLRSEGDFESAANKIKETIEAKREKHGEARVILCTHAGPDMPENTLLPLTRKSQSFSFRKDAASEAVTHAVEIIKPFLSFSGHVKFTGFGIYKNKENEITIGVKVQTSVSEGTYALLKEDTLEIHSLYNSLVLGDSSHFSASLQKLRDLAGNGISFSSLFSNSDNSLQEVTPTKGQGTNTENTTKDSNESTSAIVSNSNLDTSYNSQENGTHKKGSKPFLDLFRRLKKKIM